MFSLHPLAAVLVATVMNGNVVPAQCGITPLEELRRIEPLAITTATLRPAEATCFTLPLRRGEFIRAGIAIPPGNGSRYVRLRLFAPRADTPLVVIWSWDGWGFGRQPPAVLAFEAPASASYLVELSIPPVSWSTTSQVRIEVDEWLSAEQYRERQRALRDDPRTRWLRDNAVPLRTVDPRDEDFSDLEFLRDQLAGIRVVLLGEGSPGHGGGSEQHAKARLVRFLHRELGFDVLLFEGSLLGHSLGWRALRSGVEPRTAFRMGQYRNASLSSHVQPLIEYLAREANSARPLELAGFDDEFAGTAPRDSLVPRLRQVLRQRGFQDSFGDSASAATRLLTGLLEGGESFQRQRRQLVPEGTRSAVPDSMRETARRLEHGAPAGDREAVFWAQVIRSAANRLERGLGHYPPHWGSAMAARDRYMAQNLAWLSQTWYAGRKSIVWAHSIHVIRNIEETAQRGGYSAGQGLWDALGEQTFVIGTTVYQGSDGWVLAPSDLLPYRTDLAADRHPGIEFEELMNAAGFERAWVNLRAARRAGSWLGGPFLARPILATAEVARWSEVLDALLFVRTQEPVFGVPERP